MSAEPNAEHIDAVARVLSTPDWGEWSSAYHPDHNKWTFDGSHRTDAEREMYRNAADAILTSTDAAVHAALAASLPAEVKIASLTDAEMLAALVDRGALTEEDAPIARPGGYEHTHWQQRWDGQHTHEGRRFVTPWEVAP